MSMLAELVEVVIGVDTHNDTHTAAVVAARTGAVLATHHRGRRPRRLRRAGRPGRAARRAAGVGDRGHRRLRRRPGPPPGRRRVSWSSSWTAPPRPARRAGRSPMRSTPNAPPATPWPAPGWPQPKTGPERAGAAGAADRPPRRRGGRHRRPAATARPGHHRPRTGAGPVPRPEHPDHARHRRPAAPDRHAGTSRCSPPLTVLRALARRIRASTAEAAEHEHAILDDRALLAPGPARR